MAVSRAEKTTELQELTDGLRPVADGDPHRLQGHQGPRGHRAPPPGAGPSKGTYKVVKNTLARRAISGTAFESLAPHFQGTVALAYSEADPVVLAKTLTTFAKTTPALKIKAAVVDGKPLKATEVGELATLPGKPSSTRSCCSCCRRRWSSSSRC